MSDIEDILNEMRNEQMEIRNTLIQENKVYIKEILQFLNDKGANVTEDHLEYNNRIGLICNYPNIIQFLDERFVTDKDGLFHFDALQTFLQPQPMDYGYMADEKYHVMANRFFRRGYSQQNAFAPRFIQEFWNLQTPSIQKRISLDLNRIRLRVDDSPYFERDWWQGAKFSYNIENIPDGCIKIRPPMDIDELYIRNLFSSAYTLDIMWSSGSGIKTFQAEEVKTDEIIDNDNAGLHPVRYLHAEFDQYKKIFKHFDGAIHWYTKEQYLVRRDQDLNFNKKIPSAIKPSSFKLFRMDGEISIETWEHFTCHFFTGNPLIHEYFVGHTPSYMEEFLNKIRLQKNRR